MRAAGLATLPPARSAAGRRSATPCRTPSPRSDAVQKNEGAAGRRILMLATDAHGGFGGISQYNRDVLEALGSFDGVGEVVVLPRIVNDTGFNAPTKAHYDLAGISGQGSFLRGTVGPPF